jgi:hypothetical protein
MTQTLRRGAAASTALLLAFALSACGDDDSKGDGGSGGDGGSDAASVEDYCEIVNDDTAFEDVDLDDKEAFVEALQDFADEIEEVGVPEDIPDDAREGFEIQLDLIDDLDPDEIDLNDPESFEQGLSEDDKEKVEAYTEYENETCPDEEPTDIPTDLPTDLPTDIPTETDLGTDPSADQGPS